MRDFLNTRAHDLKQGGIRQFFDKAKNYTDVINLGIGEPDFVTPRPIIDAAYDALLAGHTRYTSNAGDITVRTQVSTYLAGYDIQADPATEILMTCGGMEAIALTLLCTVSAGDEVLIQDPQWVNYKAQIEFAGGTPVPIPVYERNAFSIKAADIEKHITPKAKILILNSPNNPTGAVLSDADLIEIAALAEKHDLLVISDEVYCELLYDGFKHRSIASVASMKNRTVVVNSFSKTFAMTGWRLGFAAAPAPIINKMVVLQENMVSCAPAPSQFAGKFALEAFCGVREMREQYAKRRDLIVAGLNMIPGITCAKPSGSFYVFPNISGLHMTSEKFANALLENAGVVCVPGSAFGKHGEGYLRLAYANSETNIACAIDRISAYVKCR